MSEEITIGVRVKAGLVGNSDVVINLIGANRTEFVRAAIQKLVDDNKVLIDYPKITEHYSSIKSELASLPQLVVVRNGSWNDVKDSTMSLLCGEFWRTSETVFRFWKELIEKYDIASDAFREYLADDHTAEKWAMHTHFWLEAPSIQNMSELLEQKSWLDLSAALRVTLSYATKKAMEGFSAEKVVKELLKTEEIIKKKKLLRLVVNARGGLRLRSQVEGKDYLSAVYTEGAED